MKLNKSLRSSSPRVCFEQESIKRSIAVRYALWVLNFLLSFDIREVSGGSVHDQPAFFLFHNRQPSRTRIEELFLLVLLVLLRCGVRCVVAYGQTFADSA
jgi:hypothetical protein